jgi:hypothetical protein
VNATISDCTLPEKILLAASTLEERGTVPFTAEALIVAVWERYPQSFGLKGFEERHPDSNKVLSALMGEKGLAKRGWLHKAGQKLYHLTRDGKQAVRRLIEGESTPLRSSRVVQVDRQLGALLQELLASSAFEKYRNGRQGELKFADACRYWGITENLTGDALDKRLASLDTSLAEIERTLGNSRTTLANGQSISADDAGALADLHGYLRQKFSPHLTLLRKRGER